MPDSNVRAQLVDLPTRPAGTLGWSLRACAAEAGISITRLEQLVAAGEVRAYRKGVGRTLLHLIIPVTDLRELLVRLICESDDAAYRMRQLPKVIELLHELAELEDSESSH